MAYKEITGCVKHKDIKLNFNLKLKSNIKTVFIICKGFQSAMAYKGIKVFVKPTCSTWSTHPTRYRP